MAKFFGIGVGPGESDLITVKGQKTLADLAYLYTPEPKKSGKSLALSIASPFIDEKQVIIKQRHFPMVNHLETKETAWNEIAEEILQDVLAGKNVGFVTLGDPMIYSTYSYLLERLTGKIETETIPGISSFCNISNQLEIPLVMDNETYAVLPATASEADIKNALTHFSTIVLMKVAVALPKIYRLLESENLLSQAVLISNSSMESEQITIGLDEIDAHQKISYFSTVIVYRTRNLK